MAGRFSLEKLKKYPHMLASDIPIWERFIEKYPNHFNSVDYDIRVGKGIEIPPGTKENIARMMTALTQKRIDVIGYKPPQTWLIEVKLYAGVGAIGQILSYLSLYKDKFPTKSHLVPSIVTDRPQPDIPELCQKSRIFLFIV